MSTQPVKGTTKLQGGKVIKGDLYAKIDETASTAKETSSVKQGFSRIRDIRDTGMGLEITLNKTKDDNREAISMSYEDACKRLFAMKKMAPLLNLEDAKSFCEIIELLEARLDEVAIKHKSIVTKDGFVSLVK